MTPVVYLPSSCHPLRSCVSAPSMAAPTGKKPVSEAGGVDLPAMGARALTGHSANHLVARKHAAMGCGGVA